MGRKLLIMPPYQPAEYHGSMEKEIKRRADMYRDVDMRSAPYRWRGGYNDRAGVMTYGDDVHMGSYEMRYDDPVYDAYDDRIRPRMGGYEPEMRRGRDSRGRYASMEHEYDGPDMRRMRRSDGTYMYSGGRVGMYSDGRDYTSSGYREDRYDDQYPRMNRIGFSMEGEVERKPEVRHEYPQEASYARMDEMSSRTGARESGYADGKGYMPMTKQMAMEWTESMENEDGTVGPHWSMDQVKTVMAQKGVECDPIEFYVALNAMYSDYAPIAKKLGVNNMDFYVMMAKAFLDDRDAQPDKLARYYEYIVK